MGFRIGIDIGGTFTDSFAINDAGSPAEAKTATTPQDLKTGVLECLDELARQYGLKRRLFLGRTDTIVHASTRGSSAVATRSGPKIGLIATRGHSDAIQLRRVRKDNMWDWRRPFPQPLVPRHLRVGVDERVDSNGAILKPLNEESVHQAVAYLKKMGVKSIVVALLFSFLNPDHERRVREIVQHDFPEAEITLSHEILSFAGEYERSTTTVIDAYVRPVMAEYIQGLENLLKEEGFKGELLFMQNNGGVETSAVALHQPGTMLVAGPSAGPITALALNGPKGLNNYLSFDMGGTCADISIIENGRFGYRNESLISEHRFSLSVTDIETIGAGGGSIAWFDLGDTLHVGPRGAGAFPGPACYGRGGTEATFTDAALVLGYLNPNSFLAGKMALKKDLAEVALREKVAARLGISTLEAAAAVYKVSSSLMAGSILHAFTTKGYDPEKFLFCGGGAAGPLCALRIAQELNMVRVLIPKYAGVYSSLGMLNADIRHDFLRFYSSLATDLDLRKIKQLYKEMEAQAGSLLDKDGVARQQRSFTRTLRMKYYGQFRDLEVPWPNGPITRKAIDEGIANFHRRHKELFGSCNEKYPLEFMKFGLSAIGKLPGITLKNVKKGRRDASTALKGRRQAYFEENKKMVSTPVFDGAAMCAGNVLEGPCIIEEKLTTLIIPPGFKVKVDEKGNYVTGGVR
jgi:N-methylhydantoinase A